MHTMAEWPQEHGGIAAGTSIDVTLYYADGSTRKGYRDGWTGWMRWDERGLPQVCEDDETQPIGWTELEAK